MGKNKAKTAASVAVEAKQEVEIWRLPQNKLSDPGFLFTSSDSFSLGCTVSPQYKSSQTTDRRQTTDRQTDRQTTQCIKGTTDIVRSAKKLGITTVSHLNVST